MIQITKEEAQMLRERFPYGRVAKTRHKYYATEDYNVMCALTSNIEAQAVVAEQNKSMRGDCDY